MTGRRLPDAVLQAFLSSHWAMTPDALRKCYEIITRQNLSPEAVSAELGRPLDNSHRAMVRDGVAYLPIVGPMIRYANNFKAISGATSYESIAQDVEAALRDPGVHAIVLNLDSPGGELSGCLDVGEQIRAADDQKPVYALASGTCASAAYLLAAATRRIVGNPSAVVGSLGVCVSIEDRSAADEAMGVRHIDIVSSQTPRKNADYRTPEGLADVQRVVNDLADAYLAPIARYRGLSVDDVLAQYGAGTVIVGAHAQAAGLIDGLAYTEDFHRELVAELGTAPRARAFPSAAVTTTASHQESAMKFAKHSKVRTTRARALSGTRMIAADTEGTVEEVTAAGVYRVAFARGSAWFNADELRASAARAEETADEPDDEEEPAAEGEADPKKKKPTPPAAEGEETDEEDEEAEPAAEGEETDEEDDEDESPAAAADPIRAERERVLGIQALALPGDEATIEACIADPTCSVEKAALRLRQAQASGPSNRLAARARSEKGKPRARAAIGDVEPKQQTARVARVVAAIGRVFPSQKPRPAAKA